VHFRKLNHQWFWKPPIGRSIKPNAKVETVFAGRRRLIYLKSESEFMAPKTLVKILIVDDNDLMRTLLRGILRNEEYEIVGEAKNGVIALEMVERFKPDLICMDVMMPEMDGLEALQSIKATHPEMRVVMVTGNPSVDNVREAIQNGASGFIVKPFNAAKVLNTLNRALQTATSLQNPPNSSNPQNSSNPAVVEAGA
jgi:two-component system chemotaxis response regulator CheY